jgi:TFIIF-interacting CTD phosphatase-like protein
MSTTGSNTTEEKSEDKKEIEDEEREKMLNEENKRTTTDEQEVVEEEDKPQQEAVIKPVRREGEGEVEKMKKALEESEKESGKKKIPIGGIKMPGFLRSRSREKTKVHVLIMTPHDKTEPYVLHVAREHRWCYTHFVFWLFLCSQANSCS